MRQGADGNLLSISSEDYLSSTPNALPRRPSINFDQNDRPKQAWGSLPRNKVKYIFFLLSVQILFKPYVRSIREHKKYSREIRILKQNGN